MKSILVVVDYQNDFITGILGFNSAIYIKDNILNKISEYRKNNDEIVFTMDTHNMDYYNTIESQYIELLHCYIGTDGWKLHESILDVKKKTDRVFIKNSFSSKALINYLKNNNYKSIEFCGLVTNICVLSNVIFAKSVLPNTKIIVDANCVDSYDKKLHFEALNVMKSIHIDILNF